MCVCVRMCTFRWQNDKSTVIGFFQMLDKFVTFEKKDRKFYCLWKSQKYGDYLQRFTGNITSSNKQANNSFTNQTQLKTATNISDSVRGSTLEGTSYFVFHQEDSFWKLFIMNQKKQILVMLSAQKTGIFRSSLVPLTGISFQSLGVWMDDKSI